MYTIASHLDFTEVFCHVDDFYQSFERHCQKQKMLTSTPGIRLCRSRLSLSEVSFFPLIYLGITRRRFSGDTISETLPLIFSLFINPKVRLSYLASS